MTRLPQRRSAPAKVSHFSWPDLLVLAGALVLGSVALYERRWFFLVIGLAILAALGIRVAVTRALAGRAEAPDTPVAGGGARDRGERDRTGSTPPSDAPRGEDDPEGRP